MKIAPPIDIVSTCHQNMADITQKQIKPRGWVEPARAASNAGQHEHLSRLRAVAIRAEEAINTTRLVARTRRATGYNNNAFPTAPIFAMNTTGSEEINDIPLPLLPEIEVQRPPGPPPDRMDDSVATGISTMAADGTIIPTTHALVSHPVPAVVLVKEAREFQIFISNSEIVMRTAAREEDKLC